jgi:hypothetical protein
MLKGFIMESYKATFGIDGGVSQGFGITYPEYSEKDEIIEAKNERDAVMKAYDIAQTYSRKHLSNPNNRMTTVKILSMRDHNKNSINLMLNALEGMDIEHGHITVKCSALEHMINIVE